ncbi:TPA: hypothetical protein DDZ86_05070 [Candidatus Dependentiae bacterium]|nr:MAG: hypothetical protein A2Y17_09875 [Clostridiales bacterium GWF2_38_85]HBL98983.1 hypothetical protein [Candidatus Dependentiae bacterium]
MRTIALTLAIISACGASCELHTCSTLTKQLYASLSTGSKLEISSLEDLKNAINGPKELFINDPYISAPEFAELIEKYPTIERIKITKCKELFIYRNLLNDLKKLKVAQFIRTRVTLNAIQSLIENNPLLEELQLESSRIDFETKKLSYPTWKFVQNLQHLAIEDDLLNFNRALDVLTEVHNLSDCRLNGSNLNFDPVLNECQYSNNRMRQLWLRGRIIRSESLFHTLRLFKNLKFLEIDSISQINKPYLKNLPEAPELEAANFSNFNISPAAIHTFLLGCTKLKRFAPPPLLIKDYKALKKEFPSIVFYPNNNLPQYGKRGIFPKMFNECDE